MSIFSRWYCRLSLVLTLGLVLLNVEPARAAKQLRWKVMAGDKFEVDMTQEMKQVLTVGDKTIEIPNTMIMSMTWDVQEVDEKGIISMTQTIDKITMTMKAPGVGEIKFDSSVKDESEGVAKMIANIIKPMVGAKYTQKMDDRGKIIDFNVPKEALKGLAANPLLKQFFSDEGFKDMMRRASPVLPEEAIEKGYKWDNNTDSKTPVGTMKLAATYTYQGEEKVEDKVLDKFDAKVNLDFVEGGGPVGTKIKIKKQDNSGTLYFDADGGHFAKTSMKQKITMEVTVGNNTINQEIETTVKMSVKRATNQ